MYDHWLDALKQGFSGGIFNATPIYLGIAAACWLGLAYNKHKCSNAAWEFKWAWCVTTYAVAMCFMGKFLGPLMPFLIGIEAFMAAPILANTASHFTISLMTAFHSFGSPMPDLSGAHHARKVGRIDEAIDMALVELEKKPDHYEGNYLLAQIFWEQQEVHASFYCLVRIMESKTCTPEQRSQARTEFLSALELARERGWIAAGATESSIREFLPRKLDRKRAVKSLH